MKDQNNLANVQMTVKGHTLTITIDLSKDLGASKSGKTHTVASTGGFVPIPGRKEILSLNCNRK